MKLFALFLTFVLPSFNVFSETINFKVLTYNIKGLPPIAAPGWGNARFGVIAERLRQQIAEGTAPDVVLLQEVFTKEAQEVVKQSGYAYFMQGPTRDGVDENGSYQKMFSSGIFILSQHPILDAGNKAYGKEVCATWDCHANKGLQYVKIKVSGIADPILIFNTHMQAEEQFDTVRVHQLELANSFIKDQMNNAEIFFFGGDFNSSPNLESFTSLKQLFNAKTAGESCLSPVSDCQVLNNTEPAQLFEMAIDHIFYSSSTKYRVAPKYVTRNFTEIFGDKTLSDHLGFEAQFSISSF